MFTGMLDLRVRVVPSPTSVHCGSVSTDKVLNSLFGSVSPSINEGLWTFIVSQLRPSCHQGVGMMLLCGTVGYISGWLASLVHQALNTISSLTYTAMSMTRNDSHIPKCLEGRELRKNCSKIYKQVN